MIHIKRAERNKELQTFLRGFKNLKNITDDIIHIKTDNYSNLLRAFSRIKDKHHRSIKVEIISNQIEAIFNKRNYSSLFFERLKTLTMRQNDLISRLVKTYESKKHTACSRLLSNYYASLGSEDGVSSADILASLTSLKRAVTEQMRPVFEVPEEYYQGLGSVCDLIDKKEKALYREFLSKLLARNEDREFSVNIYDSCIEKMREARLRDAMRRMKEIKERTITENRAIALKKIALKIIHAQEAKEKESIRKLHNCCLISVETSTKKHGALKIVPNLERLILNRKRAAFYKIIYMLKMLQFKSHLVDVHAWIDANKKARCTGVVKNKTKMIDTIFRVQRNLRIYSRKTMALSFLKIQVEAVKQTYPNNTKRLVQEANNLILEKLIQKRLKPGFEAIRRRYYRRTIQRLKLDIALNQLEEEVEDSQEQIPLEAYTVKFENFKPLHFGQVGLNLLGTEESQREIERKNKFRADTRVTG